MRAPSRWRRRSARRFKDLDLAHNLGRLHINISGCINACGHHHIGHIGILGVEKNGEEYYQVTVGGRADENAELGKILGPAVPYGDIADVVEDIAAAYLELRERPDELFRRYRQASRGRAVQGARLCHSLKPDAIIEDRFVRVLDDAPVPDGVPVILPAARLLADARELVLRQAPTGVIWPNDRRVAELLPYLDWIALVALVFPTFRDGRAYSQARLLRERHEFRGELRATGQVLRDQLLFLHRAGFDAFEVTKEKDTAAFAEALQRYSIFYQPTRRRTAERAEGAPFPWITIDGSERQASVR
jgi:uncharacterized protein (DUF934 family)